MTYGVVGLKTHCKVILVVRQDYNGLRRYAHIGTGNYHPGTARLYADYGLLTCDEIIGQDLTQLVQLSHHRLSRRAAPTKDSAGADFSEEGADCEDRSRGQIAFGGSPASSSSRCNALEDIEVTRALYRAAMAGVKIDLIVRDTCRLRPGCQAVGDVRIVSIVGRFLEHGRIYYFRNGGADEYFIGSADLMKRNLESRVEVITPVEDPLLRKELRTVLDCQLRAQPMPMGDAIGRIVYPSGDGAQCTELPAIPD